MAIWKWLLGPWMVAVTLMAFLWAKDLAHFMDPPTARIIFWHVPMAWLCLIWFFAGTIYGIRFLYGKRSGDLDLDLRSTIANEVGLICTVLATVTGMVFAYKQWGTPWNWDPKQIAITVLIVIYLAYFGVRMSISDEQTRGRIAAVYSILGAISAPVLLFVLPHLPIVEQTLHPENTTITKGLDSTWRTIYLSSWLGFTGITIWMFQIKLRAEVLLQRTAETQLLLETGGAASGGRRTEPERRPQPSSDLTY